MQKEAERNRKYRSRASEPIKINYKLMISAILILFALGVKLFPGSSVNKMLNGVIKTSTDYPTMFSEIGSVIKKHTLQSNGITMPVNGKITSAFGERSDPLTGNKSEHFGVDLDAPLNTPVSAAINGTVIKAEANSYYGNFIMIEHDNKLSTLYGHLNSISVSVGDKVKAGAQIGLSGDSGRTTGPHLHFEVRNNNIPIDPSSYIK